MNSFRSVHRALDYELQRQQKCFNVQQTIIQETRHWDEIHEVTVPSRGKEEAEDYRYFPDPDLLPYLIQTNLLEEIKTTLPELPLERKERFMIEYELTESDATVLVQDKALADFFEACIKELNKPKFIANWVITEVLKNLNTLGQDIGQSKITPSSMVELLKMIDKKEISGTIAKNVLEEMFQTGAKAKDIIAKKGISFINNEKELEKIVRQVIEQNPQSVADFLSGKEKALHFLIGQAMKVTRGQASPEMVKNILNKELSAEG